MKHLLNKLRGTKSILLLLLFLMSMLIPLFTPARAHATPISFPSVGSSGGSQPDSSCDVSYEYLTANSLLDNNHRLGPIWEEVTQGTTVDASLSYYAHWLLDDAGGNIDAYMQVPWGADPDPTNDLGKAASKLDGRFGPLVRMNFTQCDFPVVAYPGPDFGTNPSGTNEWILYNTKAMLSGSPYEVHGKQEVGRLTVDGSGNITAMDYNGYNGSTPLISSPIAPSNPSNFTDFVNAVKGSGGGSGGNPTVTTRGLVKISSYKIEFFSNAQIDFSVTGDVLYGSKTYSGVTINAKLYDNNTTDDTYEYVSDTVANVESDCKTILTLGSVTGGHNGLRTSPESSYQIKSVSARLNLGSLIPGTSATEAVQCVDLVGVKDSNVPAILPAPTGAARWPGYTVTNPKPENNLRASQFTRYYDGDTIKEWQAGNNDIFETLNKESAGHMADERISSTLTFYARNNNFCGSEIFGVNPATPWILDRYKQVNSGDCINYDHASANDPKTEYVMSAARAVAGGVTTSNPEPPSTDDGGGSGQENAPTCVSSGFSLSWFVCPMVNALADLADTMFNHIIRPFLQFPTVDISPTQPIFRVWNSMRFIGNLVLVIALLVIVFGQAIGGGLLDAYTIKKVLPRILVAAVLINISIYIVAVAIDVTNILGNGIVGLLYGAFPGGTFHLRIQGGTSAALFTGAAGTITLIFTLGIGVLTGALQMFSLLVLVPAVLAFLGVIVTLLVRLGIINILIISAPVAFALYCIPNTDKWAKKWFDLLIKTALVYPIIMVIFGMSDILAWSINQLNTQNGLATFVSNLMSIILLIAPMFLVPFAFKMAGGAVAGMYGAIKGFNKKAHQGILGSEHDPNSRRNRARTKFNARQVTQRDWESRRLKGRSAAAAARIASGNTRKGDRLRRGFFGAASRVIGGVGIEARSADLQAAESKRIQAQKATGPDDTIRDAWAIYDNAEKVWWNPLRSDSLYMKDGNNGLFYDKSDLTWDRASNKYVANRGAVGRYSGSIAGGFRDAAGHSINRSQLGIDSGAVVSGAAVSAARANAQSNPQALQEDLYYEMEKASNNGRLGRLRSVFAERTMEMGMAEDEASTLWKVVGYRHQGLHLIEKYTGFQDVIDPVTGKKTRVDKKPDLKGMAEQFGGKSRGYEQTGQSDRTWGAIRDDLLAMEAKVAAGGTLNDDELDRARYWHAGIDALDRGKAAVTSTGTLGGASTPSIASVGTTGMYFTTGGTGTAELVARQAYETMNRLKALPGGAHVTDLPRDVGSTGSAQF